MTYPFAPLPVVVEFWNGTTWVDITAYVYSRDGKGIDIRRGFRDEGSTPEPGECSFELNNRDGRFSPRNPSGPYYGLIGRNTLVRVTVTGYGVRFVGEISEWPSRWDKSGRDVWVPVTAQGILRRLGQGSRPIRSPLRVAIAAISDVVAYWPCEDEGGAFGSAIPDQPSIDVAGDVDFASVDHLIGSAPLPAFTDTTVINGSLSGQFTDRWFFTWLISILAVPSTEVTLIEIFTTGGSAVRWELKADSTNLTFTGYDASGSAVHTDTSTSSKLLDGNDQGWIGLQMFAVDATLAGLTIFDLSTTSTVGCQVSSGSIVAGSVTGFRIPADAELDGIPMGHFAVFNAVTPDGVLIPNGPEPANAFDGETAGDRAERLTGDANVEFTLVGNAGDTQTMGPQATPATFLEAFNETWRADLALAYETRDELGLSWRTRADLYNQTVALTLDYTAAGEVAPDLEPTDDDQHVRNDVTVKRTNGSSARAVEDTGPLSVADPPDGVGRYDTEVELNLYDDAVLVDFANWILHVGTTDEARYPRVHIDMAALAAQGKTSLMTAAAGLDVGDRIQITNPPSWLPPDTIDLMVVGFAETYRHPIDWDITLVCVPYSPYDIGEYQDTSASGDVPRYDTEFSANTTGLHLPNVAGVHADTPDTAALDITGDIDIRFDGRLNSWASGAEQTLVDKYNTTGNQRSYSLRIDGSGFLVFRWSNDGTTALSATSTVAVTAAPGDRLAVRVAMDVNDGAQRVVVFYTAPTMDDTFVQLGTSVTGTVTSIFNSTALLTVGEQGAGGLRATGLVIAAQVRNGIAGTIVANPNFAAQATDATSFADSAGLTWTVAAGAAIYGAFTAGTSTKMLVRTPAGPLWTTSPPGGFPILIRVSGAVLSVSNITGSSILQPFTVSTTVANGVAKLIPSGSSIHVARPAYYGL